MPRPKRIKVEVAQDERPRQGLWKAEYLGIAQRLAATGMVDREIAIIIGVSRRTFQNWLIRYPKLKEALVMPKAVADARVEMALYQTAIGYDFEEEEVKSVDGKLVRYTVRKHKPGETAAQINWLANRTDWKRNPDNYGDDLLPPPPAAGEQEAPDITVDTKRDIARRFALVMRQGLLN